MFIHFNKGMQVEIILLLRRLRFLQTIKFVRHFDCYAAMSICYVISSI